MRKTVYAHERGKASERDGDKDRQRELRSIGQTSAKNPKDIHLVQVKKKKKGVFWGSIKKTLIDSLY